MLSVRNLSASFHTRAGIVRAVRNVSFDVAPGETLGIVGESGSGKSVTCYSMMGLIPMPPGRIESGSAMLDGTDLLRCPEKELRAIRGKRISMIFQDPMTCLNPTKPVGKQIVESIKLHRHLSRQEAKEEAVKCLKQVNIPNPEERAKQYPHEFSGGQRQRAFIAMVLAQDTEYVLLDEPTNNLDIYHATQMMKLVRRLCDELGKTVILVLHERNLAAFYSDYICAFKNGKIAAWGTVNEVMTPEQLKLIYGVDFQIHEIDGRPLAIFH